MMDEPIRFLPGPPCGLRRSEVRAATDTAIEPTLVAAKYESTTSVTLVFDRAVDGSAMDAAT